MCDPTISAPNVYLVEDTFNTKEYDKKDKLNIAGYTQYVDMKFTYAAVRKGTGEKDSYSLEAITDEELGEGKIELSGDIRTTLNKDFENFLIYSLVDSYRLFQLEEKNKDIDLLFKVGQVTFTKFERTLTKTICLRNLFIDVLEKNGYILSNNKNSNNSYAEKVKFKGALVADPLLMDKVGLFLNNMYSNKIFDNVIDEDLTAMYPSLIRSGNLDISTMIGRIYSDDNPLLGELLFELMCLANKGLTANKLLNLPTASHVILNIDKYIQPIS